MTRIPRIVQAREKRRKDRRKRPFSRWGFALALLVSLTLVTLVLGLAVTYAFISRDLPSTERLQALLDPDHGALLQPTRIYARDGQNVLWSFENPLRESRSYAVLDLSQSAIRSDIPSDVVKATLAATDVDYFSKGDLQLIPWKNEETIPRILVSDLLLWGDPESSMGDIHELILANQLTMRYGREQVLEWYLNSAFYGRQTYGIASAARVYFGKDVSELNLAEAAVLAVVSQAPALNPFDAPEAVRERQIELLQQMAAEGFISEDERKQARAFELNFREDRLSSSRERPAFAAYVLDQLEEEIPRERLLRGGYKITTTLDHALQTQAQCIVRSGLSRYKEGDSGLEEGCDSARLLPTYPGLQLSESEPLPVDILQLDPRDGQVLAMYGEHPGGADDFFTPRPPGSLLTPYIYLTTFTQGYEPAALVWDIPLENENLTVRDLHPACVENCQYHGPVSIRYAMANDYLVPALAFWEDFRPANIENTLSKMGVGISPDPCVECRLFPGSHRVSILDIAHSFSIFSHGGVMRGWPSGGQDEELEPIIVQKVEDYHGKTWRDNPRVFSRAVISKELAYLITHVLGDSQARRPTMGQQTVFDIGRPAAVKRGYTYGDDGAWTVGYTPQLVTAVWVGRNGSSHSGGRGRLPMVASGLWRALTQSALKGKPVIDWDEPEGLTTLEVCLPSGLLPTALCPDTVQELFLAGTEPTQRDNLYQRVEVNRETGRLATVFTPPELIEERIYLNVPPEAQEWARKQGLSTPPQEYDAAGTGSSSPDVTISHPANFSFVKGQVVVSGTVPEEDLLSYRVQLGKGLNPDTWQQIGKERMEPVQGGILVIWDTRGVEDGLYALQLVAIREGRKVEKASTLVSVDNTPPTVSLSDNIDGKRLIYQPGEEILIRAQVGDNASVKEVTFYIEDQRVATRTSPPYAVPWDLEIGTFDLRIRVVDEAGNADHVRAAFEVVP